MFGNKLLIYIKKPSIYNIRRIRSVEERKKTLQRKIEGLSNIPVSKSNK